MNTQKQKNRYLKSEGDAWHERNRAAQDSKVLPESDAVLMQILDLPAAPDGQSTQVLEIGCGQGRRLTWLHEHLGYDCSGIDPSAAAVRVAQAAGLRAIQGMADTLPFADSAFDFVIFGFCLCYCDRADLFRIASEADRVLKDPGWMIVNDFYNVTPAQRVNHHAAGLFTYKMDYRALFTWHPSYVCLKHDVRHHVNACYTDDPQEWVAVSVLRKHSAAGV